MLIIYIYIYIYDKWGSAGWVGVAWRGMVCVCVCVYVCVCVSGEGSWWKRGLSMAHPSFLYVCCAAKLGLPAKLEVALEGVCLFAWHSPHSVARPLPCRPPLVR